MTAGLRTYLCPECDGWGEHVWNRSALSDPQCVESRPCYGCRACGVIQAEAGRDDLQRWTGDTGRERSRLPKLRIDPLASLARQRRAPRWSAAHTSDYRFLLARAMRPVLRHLRRVEVAIARDVAAHEAVVALKKAA